MKKQFFFLLISISIPFSSNSQLNLDQKTNGYYFYCKEKYSYQIHDFENKNGIPFQAAMRESLAKLNNTSDSSPSDSFCQFVIGKKYGRVEFVSKPKGKKIFVDNEGQDYLTNTTLVFEVGKYNYKIEMGEGKNCTGYFQPVSNDLIRIKCPK